jgi:uncharacterized SAM-binding protein YcdF (DUF218 family)
MRRKGGAAPSALTWAAALVALAGSWMLAVERWREPRPVVLGVVLVVLWWPALCAWSARLAPSPGLSSWPALLRLTVVLVLIDGVVEMVFPYPARLFLPGWQTAHLVLIGAAGLALAALPRLRALSAGRAGAALRAVSLATGLLLPSTMMVLALVGVRDRTHPADVALVLGYALDAQGNARGPLVARVEHAARLQRQGIVSRLILSGGVPRGGHTEAEVMSRMALSLGVPRSAIVLEPAARSTIENFACSRPLLGAPGARSALLVTEAWHMPRSLLLARRQGLELAPSPASSAEWRSWRHATYFLYRETTAALGELWRQPFAAPGRCLAAGCEGCRTFDSASP